MRTIVDSKFSCQILIFWLQQKEEMMEATTSENHYIDKIDIGNVDIGLQIWSSDLMEK